MKALDPIARMVGYMVDRVETRTGPLGQYSPDDLALVIELAQSAKRRGAITVEAEVEPAEGGSADL